MLKIFLKEGGKNLVVTVLVAAGLLLLSLVLFLGTLPEQITVLQGTGGGAGHVSGGLAAVLALFFVLVAVVAAHPLFCMLLAVLLLLPVVYLVLLKKRLVQRLLKVAYTQKSPQLYSLLFDRLEQLRTTAGLDFDRYKAVLTTLQNQQTRIPGVLLWFFSTERVFTGCNNALALAQGDKALFTQTADNAVSQRLFSSSAGVFWTVMAVHAAVFTAIKLLY